MKIVVIGGSGLIGKKLIPLLRGYEAVSASPSSGVNTLTGEGLAEALAGAAVVVDVTNSPSFEDKAVLEFFEKSTRNILAAEAAASVKHHVALSVVGADRFPDSGYMRAKVAQESLIKASKAPYTILRATQFFEFLGPIAGPGTGTVRLPSAPMQPLAADDVAAALADVAMRSPANGVLSARIAVRITGICSVLAIAWIIGDGESTPARFVGDAKQQVEDLFGTSKVWTVVLDLSAAEYQAMQPALPAFPGDPPQPKVKKEKRPSEQNRFGTALPWDEVNVALNGTKLNKVVVSGAGAKRSGIELQCASGRGDRGQPTVHDAGDAHFHAR
jgi:hypothetical protein